MYQRVTQGGIHIIRIHCGPASFSNVSEGARAGRWHRTKLAPDPAVAQSVTLCTVMAPHNVSRPAQRTPLARRAVYARPSLLSLTRAVGQQNGCSLDSSRSRCFPCGAVASRSCDNGREQFPDVATARQPAILPLPTPDVHTLAAALPTFALGAALDATARALFQKDLDTTLERSQRDSYLVAISLTSSSNP